MVIYMAQVRNVAPFINETFWVTEEFGEPRGSRYHKAVDLATRTAHSNLYSIMDGKVTHNSSNASLGNYIIIENQVNHLAFLYAHMNTRSPLSIGTSVRTGQLVGQQGTTGESTGPHVHVELQDLSNRRWTFSTDIRYYMNPCDYMGIDNIYYSSWIYNGTPTPPTPPAPIPTKFPKTSYNWVLNAKQRRNKKKFLTK